MIRALSLLLLAASACAQTAPPAPPALDAPDRPLVVMNLAAHPDDEDGLTMAYYRGNQDAVVYSVVYTRGEGGQNEAGPDLYERLGAIRTAETEAAARIVGSRVVYLDRFDFGFSKAASEAFGEWSRARTGFWDTDDAIEGPEAGRDALVADVVRLVRRLKPDVMFTNHDTTTAWPDAQHGHHQAVGISSFQAFSLAADPSYRPEQLDEEGVDLWQPQRLFLRVGGFSSGTPDGYDVTIPVADECAQTAVRPAEACADRAVAAAGQHVSQGFDVFAPRFRREATYFRLVASAPGAPALPDDATDLAAGLAPNPAADALDLATLVDAGRVRPAALAVSSETVVPSREVFVTWDALPGATITVYPPPGAPTQGLFAAEPVTADASAGRLRVPIASGTTPSAPAYRQQYGTMTGGAPLLYAVRDASGELVAGGRLPVQIVPPATVDLDAQPIRLVAGRNAIRVDLTVFDAMSDTVDVGLMVYRGDRAVWFGVRPVAARDGGTTFPLDLPDAAPGAYRVEASARTTGCGLPWFTVSRPAAVLPDVAVAPGLRVGFVESYDGTTARALEVMGADVVALDSTALATSDFAGLHTIVVDIRALLERGDLREHRQRLIDWVERGGHLVVGYHKTFEWNSDGGLAPFPLALGRDRVTHEEAPVAVLAPDHPLFQSPHALSASDWDGWVQERGLYFPAEIDGRYRRLLAVGDPGEAALDTALLLASHGAGTYVYSPLGWYRQLAALVPGAWRTYANLVSLPLTDGRAEQSRATGDR
ncbi:PIG-L family deacetylase [Rubrivirga sp. IMCC43871]|uniref:PIG-L family deacetylase n=1 Tax=Rubrivirga sp. IMCC43871 TaxID=3391575 RepID=UPI00399017E9